MPDAPAVLTAAEDAATAPSLGPAPEPAPPPQPEADCRLAWRLDTEGDATVLGADIAGAVTAVLLLVEGRFELLLVAPSGGAIALRLDPDDTALCVDCGPGEAPHPLGAVISGGNQFLAVFGVSSPERTWVRARSFLPDGSALPVDAPGRPGADGSPTLDFPGPTGGPASLRVLPLVRHVIVAARPAAASEPPTLAVVSYSGAPIADSPWPERLEVRPGTDSDTDWLRIRSPWAPEDTRLLAPLGDGLLVAGPDGLRRLSSRGQLEPLAFDDGWRPGTDSSFGYGAERIVRIDPPAGGPAAMVAYDPRGRIAARRRLPAEGRIAAAARDGRSVLLLDAEGRRVFCTAVEHAPADGPVSVDWRGPVRTPREGGTCGR